MFLVLGVLTALAIYVAGWDYFVFGVAAAFCVLGGIGVWIGVGIALAQAVRLVLRRTRGRPAQL